MQLCKGGGTHFWSQVGMHTCTDAYTYSKQGVGPKVWDWDTYTVSQMAPMIPCNYAKGMELTWRVRWTCTHVLMNVHILI